MLNQVQNDNKLYLTFRKAFAFTLAETLIVMGIIGVVAALTIPNLSSSTANKENVARVQKAYQYAGFKGAIQSQYVSDQYLTNTGFKEMMCQDENGNTTYETLLLKKHFTTNIDLSYHFSLKKLGMKDATVGVTLYNIFDSLYDNNGWAAPQYRKADGKVITVNTWNVRDRDAAGFAPSAPFNCMAHLSINF